MNLTNQLSTLEAAGLVRLAQTLPELAYLFRHSLVQDAAYSVLLQADRQSLHRVIGEILEQFYQDHLAEMAPQLGRHFALAGDRERGLKYLTPAALTRPAVL